MRLLECVCVCVCVLCVIVCVCVCLCLYVVCVLYDVIQWLKCMQRVREESGVL